jgi:hypothetical protein
MDLPLDTTREAYATAGALDLLVAQCVTAGFHVDGLGVSYLWEDLGR